MKKAPIIAGVVAICAAIVIALFATGVIPNPLRSAGPAADATPEQKQEAANVRPPAESSEAAVKQALESFTDSSQNNIEAVLGAPLCTALNEAGVDPREVFDAFYGHISYEIDESSLPESGSGVVNVKVTNIDAATAAKNYLAAFDAWRSSSSFDVGDEAAIWKKEVEMLKEAYNDPSLETKTYDLTAEVVKREDGGWRLVNEKALFAETLGGYTPDTLL